MNRTLTLALAVAAGLFGGMLARYVPSADAKPEAPNVKVRWQAVTLIDAEGRASQVVRLTHRSTRFGLIQIVRRGKSTATENSNLTTG